MNFKKILFVDRDGTLIVEPPITEQINSLEELKFMPFVISSLKKFINNGFEIIMVTNQNGLGSVNNPLENYKLINKKMFEVFNSEGIIFSKLFCCPHFASNNCNCRKPKTGLVDEYLKTIHICKKHSLMVGDIQTDMQFAKNIKVHGFLISETQGWPEITKLALSGLKN
ncbi:D,D-heptose 1,7-bisphosphate phosphatase [Candidatus Xenohaliotis californiensis]|uniref:D,D-heptose 1,7-bisphosphate phosphatase n=1 Tax=Candidatus Xenohaliotis californiensis TaxID=84677 RepID=A0ABM9N8L6_9RICK|nr:D,D-heptose 1,7-bisphosphate phosphatase [Candidatus Xenohaliotis californiensis]